VLRSALALALRSALASALRSALASALRSAPGDQSVLQSAPGDQSVLRSAPTSGLSLGAVSPSDAADALLAAVAASNWLTAVRSVEHESPSAVALPLVMACWLAAAYLSATPQLAAPSASLLVAGAASPLVIGAQALQSAPERCLRLAQSDRVSATDEAGDWLAAVLR